MTSAGQLDEIFEPCGVVLRETKRQIKEQLPSQYCCNEKKNAKNANTLVLLR
jgi:hypothetical protein